MLNKSREVQVEVAVLKLVQILPLILTAACAALTPWPCRSDFLSPARLHLTFRHAALRLGYLWPRLAAARPSALGRNFRSSKCQTSPHGQSLLCHPALSGMQRPPFTRAREVGARRA